jgi:hypothetical protein
MEKLIVKESFMKIQINNGYRLNKQEYLKIIKLKNKILFDHLIKL